MGRVPAKPFLVGCYIHEADTIPGVHDDGFRPHAGLARSFPQHALNLHS